MWGDDVTFTSSDFTDQGTSGTGSAITATKSGVTVWCDKGYGTTQLRCYKGGDLRISSDNTITSISFTFSGSYTGGLNTSYSDLSTTLWRVESLSSQARFAQIVVTYEAGGGGASACAIPTFSPAAGAVAYNSSVSISCATADATIHYTTNGTDPTSSSATYSSPISITTATTIKAIAVKDGLTDSEIGTAAYTIAAPDAPTFNVASGAIPAGTKVTITGTGTIRYTTNGTDPTSSTGTVYSEPVEINSSCTLKAICVDGGGNASSVTSANYGIVTPVAGYTIDFESVPVAYTDWTMTNVERGSGTISAQGGTYYGTTGGKASASIVTKAKVAKPETLTFYVSKTTSNTTSSTWYVEVSSDGSSWTEISSQSATSMTAGNWTKVECEIKNNLDVFYTDVYIRIRYDGSTALRTIDDITLTEVAPVATPTFSLEAGTYNAVQSVTINCATDGATIYYTTDGSTPTSSSTVYSGAVSITTSCTLKAIAIKGDDNSNVASTAYVIELPTEYNLATSIISGKHYVITNGKADGSVYIMNTQNDNNRSSKSATVSSSVLTATAACEFVIAGPDADGFYTIYDATAKGYLYAASSSSNYLRTQATINDNARWSIVINGSTGVATIKAQGTNSRNWIRNNGSIFSCYSSGQSDVYLFELDGEATPTENVTVGAAGYTTYTPANAVSFPDGVKGYIVTATGADNVTLIEKASVPARTPIIIEASAGNYDLTSVVNPANVAGNLLLASDGKVEGDESTIFALGKKNDEVGFYLVKSGDKVPAGKAYLEVAGGGAVKSFLAFDFGTTDAIKTVQGAGLKDAAIFNLAGQRMSRMHRGVNLVNGKKIILK